MPSFEIYVDDDRYEVPSLYLVNARDEGGARSLAQRLLDESAHHQGVELRRDGERIFALGSYARTEDATADAAPLA